MTAWLSRREFDTRGDVDRASGKGHAAQCAVHNRPRLACDRPSIHEQRVPRKSRYETLKYIKLMPSQRSAHQVNVIGGTKLPAQIQMPQDPTPLGFQDPNSKAGIFSPRGVKREVVGWMRCFTRDRSEARGQQPHTPPVCPSLNVLQAHTRQRSDTAHDAPPEAELPPLEGRVNIRIHDTPTDTCSPGSSDAFSCSTGQGFLNSRAVDRFLVQINAARAWINARGGTRSQD